MLEVCAAIPLSSLLTVDIKDPGLEPPSRVTISVDSETRLSLLDGPKTCSPIGSPNACKF